MIPDAENSSAADRAAQQQQQQRRRRLLQVGLAVLLVLLPVLLHVVYRSVTSLPRQVTLAMGPEGGRYEQFMSQLADELQRRGVNVTLRRTEGSLEHLQLLQKGQVDLALYQANPGTVLSTRTEQTTDSSSDRVTFVANVYSEVVHLLVRHEAGINSVAELDGRRVSLSAKESGDHAMARLLLNHFGLSEGAIQAEFLDYSEIEQKFGDATLDAAFVVTDLDAPVLQSLVGQGTCRLLSVPHRDALVRRQPLIGTGTVPAGYYALRPEPRPAEQVESVSVHAQLLSADQVSGVLVETVTLIVLDPTFQKRNRLGELLSGNEDFARNQPEFQMHPAALRVYNPELRSLVDPALIDVTEGLRSLIASLLIAGFVAWRWWKRRTERSETHRLETYVEALEEVERLQVRLDSGRTSSVSDIDELQQMLDKVTELRWQAMEDLSVHDQMEDAAVGNFLNMCNALTSKINAKLSRARLDRRFDELIAHDGAGGAEVPEHDRSTG